MKKYGEHNWWVYPVLLLTFLFLGSCHVSPKERHLRLRADGRWKTVQSGILEAGRFSLWQTVSLKKAVI